MKKIQKNTVDKSKTIDYSHAKHTFLIGLILFMSIFFINSAYSFSWNSSVVAYYGFNEGSGTTSADSTSNNYDLVGWNTPGWNSSGKIGSATDLLKSSSEYWSNSTNATALLMPYPFTINAWVKFDTITAYDVFLSKSITATDGSVRYRMGIDNANNLFSGSHHTAGTTYITGNSTITTGTWYMVTLRVNSSGMNMYLNGNHVAAYVDNSNAALTPVSERPLLIGAFIDGGPSLGNYFDGLVDEVLLSNRSLSDSEITELYNNGNGLPYGLTCSYEYNGINNSLGCGTFPFQIYSPVSLENYGKIDGILNFNYSSGGVNYSVPITTTNQKNLTIYFKNSTGQYSQFVSWDYRVLENNRTHNLSAYETDYQTYSINVTANSSLTAINLLFNGTSYAMTNQGSGIWSYSRDVPSSNAGNNSIQYRFTYGGTNFNSETSYQNITTIIFTACNSTYATKFLNISFKDESDSTAINASIPTSTFEYYIGQGTQTKNYTYINNTENYYYAFCAYPNLSFQVNPYVQYKQGTDYPQRIWDSDVLTFTNTVTNKILYLLSSSDGIYVTFQVINSADQVISGVLALATRLIGGETITIAQGTTGASGTVTFWLNPDFEHTFSFSKSGYDSYTYSDTPTQTSYTITLGGSSTSQNSTFRGIDYSIIPLNTYLTNDTVYKFAFNLTSSYWDVSEYGFNLRLSNGTIISGGTTGTEGTELSLNYNTTNKTIIYIDAYWIINGNYTNITKYWVIQNTQNTGWSIKTLFEDINAYINSGIFGLDDFGKYLIVFIIIFVSSGIVSYKYGLTSSLSISTIIFGIIFFFDVVVGLIPEIRGISHLLTYLSALILVILIFREVQT